MTAMWGCAPAQTPAAAATMTSAHPSSPASASDLVSSTSADSYRLRRTLWWVMHFWPCWSAATVSALAAPAATERVELAARLEPLHDLTRGLLLLHERLQVPQRAAAAVEGLQDVIGVQRGGVGHEAVEFVREALLDAVVVAQPAEPSHHRVAEGSLRVVRGLVGDVYPALPGPREVEAREVVRHPVRESLPGFEFHAANLPKHLADNLGHHLREARDRLAQVLDHDVVEHGLVRGPGQREHLAE